MTLSNMGRTEMSRLVNSIAPVCSIQKLYFGNVLEGHGHGSGETLAGEVDLFLTRAPYNTQLHQKHDHVEYAVVNENARMVMAKVLRD